MRTSGQHVYRRIFRAAFSLLICARLLGADAVQPNVPAAVPSAPDAPNRPGSLEGTVTFVGDVPRAPVPDDAGMRRDLIEVDPGTRGLRYVVLHLRTQSPAATATNGTASSAVQESVVVDQLDNTFVPHVIAVRAGEPVMFKNSDPANHNVRTTSAVPQNEFNVFTGSDGKYQHRFALDPRQRPVRVGCDIHPWMRAWVYVFDHHSFAVTDQEGRFRISPVLPGSHTLVIRQPDIGYIAERAVVVSAGAPTKVEVRIQAQDVRSQER